MDAQVDGVGVVNVMPLSMTLRAPRQGVRWVLVVVHGLASHDFDVTGRVVGGYQDGFLEWVETLPVGGGIGACLSVP